MLKTNNNMQLDINRLHDVFLNNTYGNRIGKTTAVCYQALGFCDVMDHVVVFIIVDNCEYVKQTCNKIFNYAKEYQITINSLNKSSSHCVFYLPNYNSIVVCTEEYTERYTHGLDYINYKHIILFDFINGLNSAQEDDHEKVYRQNMTEWANKTFGKIGFNIELNFKNYVRNNTND